MPSLESPLKFRIREERTPLRCEICHQADAFDPATNHCSRCERPEVLGLIAPASENLQGPPAEWGRRYLDHIPRLVPVGAPHSFVSAVLNGAGYGLVVGISLCFALVIVPGAASFMQFPGFAVTTRLNPFQLSALLVGKSFTIGLIWGLMRAASWVCGDRIGQSRNFLLSSLNGVVNGAFYAVSLFLFMMILGGTLSIFDVFQTTDSSLSVERWAQRLAAFFGYGSMFGALFFGGAGAFIGFGDAVVRRSEMRR